MDLWYLFCMCEYVCWFYATTGVSGDAIVLFSSSLQQKLC